MKGKHIVVGITGGIAAYKTATLVRLFVKAGAEVQVIMTPNAKEFITPVTLSTLSGKPVISEFFTIAKMANGVADNMLVTSYLSTRARVFVAPAMDFDMMRHPSTTRNLSTLAADGAVIIEPTEGELASHLVGKGRMEEPEMIFDLIDRYFKGRESMTGNNVLITAGPTREKIDPVRYISNYSTGKMGIALAEEAAARGAEVTLVLGPVERRPDNPRIRTVDVESAKEMLNACEAAFPECDMAIMCAAVATLGKIKRPGQMLVGFALETDNETENATEKMKRKNLDMIVMNSLCDKGAGFGTDTNKKTILKVIKQPPH